MSPIKIGLVGVGKIARDQHLPALAANPDFQLVAVASRNQRLEGVPSYPDIAGLLSAHPEIEALTLCTPPQGRRHLIRECLDKGRHVMVEKPPGATVGEVEILADLARAKGLSLFTTWHSRHAAAVEPARAWLAGRTLTAVRVIWKEDVRVWHPGQHWIWQPGGLGVFDPGINGLSIVTRILPRPLILEAATLDFPANCQAPIAAHLAMRDSAGLPVSAEFDFLQTGPQSWDVAVETDAGTLTLSLGGGAMVIDGVSQNLAPAGEYPGLYSRFAELVEARAIDADLSPLRLVADAFLCGERRIVEPFIE
jgi:D-galactose 1-dehydrogenase